MRLCVYLSYHSNISGRFSLPRLLLFSRRRFWLNLTGDCPDLALTITGNVIFITITTNMQLSTGRGNPQPCSPKPPSLHFRHCFSRNGKANARPCMRGKKQKQETQMHNVGTNELKVCPWLSDDLQNCYFRALQVTVFN